MDNWKTTVTGAITGICGVLAFFKILVPPEVAAGVASVAIALGLFFAKDGKASPK